MGDGIQINRTAERFSSHTLCDRRPAAQRTSTATKLLREQLIAATIEVVAEGSDPRLSKSLAPA
jgi:hypothetical protein